MCEMEVEKRIELYDYMNFFQNHESEIWMLKRLLAKWNETRLSLS